MRKLVPRRYVTSKWLKTKALLPVPALAKHIPDTRLLTRPTLKKMLDTYGMVYIKPSVGSYGNGVIRVEKRREGAGSYAFHAGLQVRTFAGYDTMYQAILKLIRKRLYLAQKGIHLLKYKGRRFDLRVMVQKSPEQRWVATGVIGRMAAARKAVTNVHNGGTVVPAERLLAGHAGAKRQTVLLSHLRSLGLGVAKQMERKYPGVRELGLDVALDERLYPWILEVNTSPDPYIFRKLKDRRIFARIIRYAKAYGRR